MRSPLPLLALALASGALAGPRAPHPAWRDRALALERALALRDPATGAHCVRTGALARLLAPALGVDPARAALAGRLHDLGKLAMPDSILRGTQRLSAAEYARVKLHPVRGGSLAASLGLPGWLVDGIRHHHERWDGGGYPSGRARDAIPPIARVVGVADTLDAICSPRTYKPARPPAEAFAVLARTGGSQHDPTVTRYALEHRAALAARLEAMLGAPAAPEEAP